MSPICYSAFSDLSEHYTDNLTTTFNMGLPRSRRFYCLLELFCVFVISFTSSQSFTQRENSGIEEDSSENSYFLYQRPGYPRDCSDVKRECLLSNSSGRFLINPDGYPEHFEVYCLNDFQLGGWTVIQRRVDGSVDFNREWQDYKDGFGFLSTEFWIGNEKLSYLTNQARYELRIDIELSNGTSLFASYAAFRISDEWSRFSLVDVGDFLGDIDFSCPENMTFGNCSCQPSCDDPSGFNSCDEECIGNATACICSSGFLMKDGKCVLRSECGCFLNQTNSVLLAGDTYVSADCSEKCTCEEGVRSCNSNYACDPNAECRMKDSVRDCYCNRGYEGDGETCTVLYTDCYDAYKDGNTVDGVYSILPSGWPGAPFSVLCNMTIDGGGWTVFQRRIDGVSDFYRNWTYYKHGFGSISKTDDFWLGNEQLYFLTNQRPNRLRVDITKSDGSPLHAEYSSFSISSETLKYKLSVGSLTTGDAGDGLYSYENGGYFTTREEDNDECIYRNCAAGLGGAGWYTPRYCYQCSAGTWSCSYYGTSSCLYWCSYFNLNGIYNGVNGQNIFWYGYCNLKYADMKIRPSSV